MSEPIAPQSAWEAFGEVQKHVNNVGMVNKPVDDALKVVELFIRAALAQNEKERGCQK